MDTEIKFRVDTRDKGRFEAAAEQDGRKLSDWVRRACFAALPESFEGPARPVDPEWQKKVMEAGESFKSVTIPAEHIQPGKHILDFDKEELTKPSGETVKLTRAEREARNLAFQKQTGMSGGKKK